MTTMFILVRFCICVLSFYKLNALGTLMAPLGFALQIVDKLICSCLCLLDAIVDLHTMDERIFNAFLIGT